MKIGIQYDWDWHIFRTPAIEISDSKTLGYPFVMLCIGWFWIAVDFNRQKNF